MDRGIAPSLFFSRPRLELFAFAGAGLLVLGLLVPYLLWGEPALGPIFGAHVVLLSLPHHFLTIASMTPKGVQKGLRKDLVALALGAAILVSLASAGWADSGVGRFAGTAIGLLSVWHIYRQHLGICRVYDAVQSRRNADPTVFRDRRFADAFLGLGSFGMVVWLFTHKDLAWENGGGRLFVPLYPRIPDFAFKAYLVVVGILFVLAVAQSVVLRARRKRPVPWPQLAIIASAVVTNNALFLVVPPKATLLVVTAASSAHIVQYFVFVWLFERQRAAVLADAGERLPLSHALVHKGQYVRWAALALGYSLLLMGVFALRPKDVGVFTLTLSNVFHYLVDGVVWRRGYSPTVGPAVARLSQQ